MEHFVHNICMTLIFRHAKSALNLFRKYFKYIFTPRGSQYLSCPEPRAYPT